MFERYTPRARRALVLAQEEGRLLGQDFVGSEHILVGLARAEGIAASALVAVGADAEARRRQLRGGVRPRPRPMEANGAFTADAKQVLELALREADQLGHGHIGTEHLLLGVASLPDSAGAHALAGLGVSLAEVRRAGLEAAKDAAVGHRPLIADGAQPPWRHRAPRGGYRTRPLARWGGRPVLVTAGRALVWGAAVRGVTKARWRASLLVGGALAGGSVVLRRGHRHGRWSWRPNRAGLSRYEGPSRTTQEAPGSVPSPGGWEVPPGLRPMWDWTPPGGGRPRLDRVPAIVRAWYELPFVDRYAHAWMWHHGGWDIASPSGPAGDSAGGA